MISRMRVHQKISIKPCHLDWLLPVIYKFIYKKIILPSELSSKAKIATSGVNHKKVKDIETIKLFNWL